MQTSFKSRPAYYSVHGLRDGTIWLAVQTRKPRRTRDYEPKIDADGIHRWFLDEEDPKGMNDWAKNLLHGAVANRLNVKRAIREQVEPKLDELLRLVGEMGERIARLEERLGEGA